MFRSWNFFSLTAFVATVVLSGCTITTSDSSSSGGAGGDAGSDAGGATSAGGAAAEGGTSSTGGTSAAGGATSEVTLEEAATEACKLTAVEACKNEGATCVETWQDAALASSNGDDCTAETTTYLICVGALAEADVTCDAGTLAPVGCDTEFDALNTCWGF